MTTYLETAVSASHHRADGLVEKFEFICETPTGEVDLRPDERGHSDAFVAKGILQ